MRRMLRRLLGYSNLCPVVCTAFRAFFPKDSRRVNPEPFSIAFAPCYLKPSRSEARGTSRLNEQRSCQGPLFFCCRCWQQQTQGSNKPWTRSCHSCGPLGLFEGRCLDGFVTAPGSDSFCKMGGRQVGSPELRACRTTPAQILPAAWASSTCVATPPAPQLSAERPSKSSS